MSSQIRRVLTFGEMLIDELPTGRRPGGGPFNTAAHLVSLGTPAAVVTAVGSDERGAELRRSAHEQGVDGDLIQQSSLPTGVVQVTLGQDGEPSYEIIAPVAWDDIRYPSDANPVTDSALESLPAAVSQAQALLFWLLGVRNPTSAATLRQVLAKAPTGIPKIVDLGLRADFYSRDSINWLLKEATIAKLNQQELSIITSVLGLENSASALAATYSLDAVIITNGAVGASSYRNGTYTSVDPPKVAQVVDTVGCGDAFTAGYLHALLQGADETACLQAGCAQGGYAATRHGGLPKAAQPN